MAVDPKFAEQIEKDIAGIPQAHRQMYAQAKMDGMEIHGFAVFRSGATRTNGSGNGSAAAGMKAGNRQGTRTHREKEKFIQEAARKRTEKKEAEEQLLDLKA